MNSLQSVIHYGVNSGIRSVCPMRCSRTAQARIFFQYPHCEVRSALSRRGRQTIHRIVCFAARSNPIAFVEIELYELFAEYRSLWGE